MTPLPANAPCPCGTKSSYAECCGKYHAGHAYAETAEKLMRSRYSAFVTRNGDYLAATLAKEKRAGFDPSSIADDTTQWLGLEIIERNAGGVLDQTGRVEFVARFSEDGRIGQLHERSYFERRDGKWFYVDGVFPEATSNQNIMPQTTETANTVKVGRNDPCPCGSGRKFKKCCG